MSRCSGLLQHAGATKTARRCHQDPHRHPNVERLGNVLTRGAVDVGPNNTAFHPHPESTVWVLKDSRQNLTIKRRTRSKFNDPKGKKRSGIKLVAFIFHQLNHTHRLDRIDIESKLQDVASVKSRTQRDSKVLSDVRELVLTFEERDYASFPVDWKNEPPTRSPISNRTL
ncbi:hypothetical protein BGZ88_005850 [Linnemannia elongata]|nr:hypothetical protein BGZ88_005850 [Linnemannia elongata]